MSTTLETIELLLHRRLVQDYSFTVYIIGYESEIEFEVPMIDLLSRGPPAVPAPDAAQDKWHSLGNWRRTHKMRD